jgi:hypothetical protein
VEKLITTKKGHAKYVQTLAYLRENNIIVEDDDIDIPSIVQVILSYFNIHAHI